MNDLLVSVGGRGRAVIGALLGCAERGLAPGEGEEDVLERGGVQGQRVDIEITQAYAAAGVTDPARVGHDYGRALARLIDADRFPALMAALAENVFDDDDQDWDVVVEFGLERILDGIGVLISARQQAEPDVSAPQRLDMSENLQKSS